MHSWAAPLSTASGRFPGSPPPTAAQARAGAPDVLRHSSPSVVRRASEYRLSDSFHCRPSAIASAACSSSNEAGLYGHLKSFMAYYHKTRTQPIAGKGHTDKSIGAAAGTRVGGRAAPSWRASSSVRTSGSVIRGLPRLLHLVFSRSVVSLYSGQATGASVHSQPLPKPTVTTETGGPTT